MPLFVLVDAIGPVDGQDSPNTPLKRNVAISPPHHRLGLKTQRGFVSWTAMCACPSPRVTSRQFLNAAGEGRVADVARALDTGGCTVNMEDGGRVTALHRAAAGGHLEVVRTSLAPPAHVPCYLARTRHATPCPLAPLQPTRIYRPRCIQGGRGYGYDSGSIGEWLGTLHHLTCRPPAPPPPPPLRIPGPAAR
jgi:hypothetical protein